MALSSFFETCTPSTFSLSLFGAEIISIQASVITNYTADVDGGDRFTAPSISLQNASFCNVTVTYTHPGYEDGINTEAWLPVDNWNGRFLAHGGGGHRAGRFPLSTQGMAGAIHDGFATITTDAGLDFSQEVMVPWALLSPGNVNLHKLQNLASTSLNDLVSPDNLEGGRCPIQKKASNIRQRVGSDREVSYQKLLWETTFVFLLERMLSGWSTRSDARAEIPNSVRRHRSRCSSNLLDRNVVQHILA